ncbi:forkhead box protein M1 isoform X1 [Octopus vulgaris]|uniref:Forkhead box protein M1 isoform X1 n=1 Tax=Octopus vulgaris TaxID=6645 RepID=A0AA36AUS9_OCTVU|nr:forkhead box protein M1 isoform X1 [Octopus vulgaris]
MEGGNNIYTGSPDSPHFSRRISRLSDVDDIKRDLSNITDDSNDDSYPLAHINPVFSSPSNSIDSGFQSPSIECLSLSFSPDISLSSNHTSSSQRKDYHKSTINGSTQYPKQELDINFASPEGNVSSWTTKTPSTSFIELSLNDSSSWKNNVVPLADPTPMQCSTPLLPRNLKILATPPVTSCSTNNVEFILNSQSFQLSSLSSSTTSTTNSVGLSLSKPKELVIEILKPVSFSEAQISPLAPTASSFQTATLNNQPKIQTKPGEKLNQTEKTSNPQTLGSSQFNKRPPFSYVKLIENALNSRHDKRMTLKEIYRWIETNYPYYSNTTKLGWKNSIRHDLSTNKCFVREPTRYYGSHWKLVSTAKDTVSSSSSLLSSSSSSSSSSSTLSTATSLSLPSSVLTSYSSPSLSSVATGSKYKPQSPVVNTMSSIPSVISSGTHPKLSINSQTKANTRRKEPPLILPRPNVAPQAYALIPIHTNNLTLQNPSTMSTPLIIQLPTISTTNPVKNCTGNLMSSTEIPTSQRYPLTSTPILPASNNHQISVKDLLLFDQNSLSKSQNLAEEHLQSLPQETAEQHSSKRLCLKANMNLNTTTKKSLLSDHHFQEQKPPANKKNRRKQKFVLKEMNPLDSSVIEDSFSLNKELRPKVVQSISNTSLDIMSSSLPLTQKPSVTSVPNICDSSLDSGFPELTEEEDQTFLSNLDSNSIYSRRKPNILSRKSLSQNNFTTKQDGPEKLSSMFSTSTSSSILESDFGNLFDISSASCNNLDTNKGDLHDQLKVSDCVETISWDDCHFM